MIWVLGDGLDGWVGGTGRGRGLIETSRVCDVCAAYV